MVGMRVAEHERIARPGGEAGWPSESIGKLSLGFSLPAPRMCWFWLPDIPW